MRAARVMALALFSCFVVAAAATARARSSRSHLRLMRIRSSPLGRHECYRQPCRGPDVPGGVVGRHVLRSGAVVTRDGRGALCHDIEVIPAIAAEQAQTAAQPPVVRTGLAVFFREVRGCSGPSTARRSQGRLARSSMPTPARSST